MQEIAQHCIRETCNPARNPVNTTTMNYKSREEYYLFGRLNVLVCSVWESKKVYRATYKISRAFFLRNACENFPIT